MLAYRVTDRLADISTDVSEEAMVAFGQQGTLRPGRIVVIHNDLYLQECYFCGNCLLTSFQEITISDGG